MKELDQVSWANIHKAGRLILLASLMTKQVKASNGHGCLTFSITIAGIMSRKSLHIKNIPKEEISQVKLSYGPTWLLTSIFLWFFLTSLTPVTQLEICDAENEPKALVCEKDQCSLTNIAENSQVSKSKLPVFPPFTNKCLVDNAIRIVPECYWTRDNI